MAKELSIRVRVRILRNSATVRVRGYRTLTLPEILTTYKKLSSTLPVAFRFQIEAKDKSVIWIGGGTNEAKEEAN